MYLNYLTDLRCAGICASLLIGLSESALAQTTRPATMAASRPHSLADVATPKLAPDGKGIEERFTQMHQAFLQRAKAGRIDLLFVGDSITEAWAGRGKTIWANAFSGYNVANFGISGDRTEHVLWRIENGELDHISPKVVVLLIGTNNLGFNTPGEIAAGNVEIISEIHRRLPRTKVLVMGIFPRGAKPNGPNRDAIRQINSALAKLDDFKMTRFLDLSSRLLTAEGELKNDVAFDFIHLTEKGYAIWADAMQGVLNGWMF